MKFGVVAPVLDVRARFRACAGSARREVRGASAKFDPAFRFPADA